MQLVQVLPATAVSDEEDGPGHMALEGVLIGLATGSLLGALVTCIASASAVLVIPGFGDLAAGPLLVVTLGAAAGAVNGGLAGALIGWSIPSERDKPLTRCRALE